MDLIGLATKDPEWYQVLVRTVIVFITALAFIRISGMRTFGTQNAFDIVVSITLGALLSRAITGHYPFFNCLGAACLLVVLHRVTGHLSAKSNTIKKLAEGEPQLLFTGGELVRHNMVKYCITEGDIMQALHEANIDGFETVRSVILETDGTISIVKKTGK